MQTRKHLQQINIFICTVYLPKKCVEVDGENIKTSIDVTINAPHLTMVVIFGIKL